ncbi:kinase-like domain-containing protein [Trametes polyzona]|nr:kinase-like domain-containing protein [Trametes polyzona]
MPPWKHLTIAALTTAGLAALFSSIYVRKKKQRHENPVLTEDAIRKTLPPDLKAWRAVHVKGSDDSEVWEGLQEFLAQRGYTLWPPITISLMALPATTDVASGGFGYAPIVRGWEFGTPMAKMFRFSYPHPSCQAAQASDGRSVVIRVLAIGNEGREHINILKLVSRGAYSLVTHNHAVPLLDLIDFVDITFGVFPKIGADMADAYCGWAENSVGDILDMIMQCLEALCFIHHMSIAHRDAFKDNFLVQWHPESLRARVYPASRPRVYLNDFETAVHFPPEVAPQERLCVGLPLGPSFPTDEYMRPIPPEVQAGTPYDPFKLDMWQFGTSFQDFRSNIPEVDQVLESMRNPDPSLRPSAFEAQSAIGMVLWTTPQHMLLYPPEVINPDAIPVDDAVAPADVSPAPE